MKTQQQRYFDVDFKDLLITLNCFSLITFDHHHLHKIRETEEMNKSPSISVLPEGCISDLISCTSPRDASRFAAISKLFNAAADSDSVWERFLPSDYRDVIGRAVSAPVVFDSKKQLYVQLSDSYLLLDRGRLAFKLDKETGKKCYMLGARDLSIAWQDDARYWEWGPVPGSRFAEAGILREVWWLDIRGIIDTSVLSQESIYGAYLVYRVTQDAHGLGVPAKTIVTLGEIRNETSNVYLQQPRVPRRDRVVVTHTMRKDGWMEIKLGEFYCSDGDEGEVEMVLHEHLSWKSGLIVEGIEVRPN
ncbi:putative F-box protein PP2-B12 isoform X2 [Rutidosis leptorrhynchoides]|uniref:putative F-box protein PP2-B12 isoform X2 n=1 Tax=Rutidosis leptorrhynchoides TaxID=125765 RepID=UPI003A9A535B